MKLRICFRNSFWGSQREPIIAVSLVLWWTGQDLFPHSPGLWSSWNILGDHMERDHSKQCTYTWIKHVSTLTNCIVKVRSWTNGFKKQHTKKHKHQAVSYPHSKQDGTKVTEEHFLQSDSREVFGSSCFLKSASLPIFFF